MSQNLEESFKKSALVPDLIQKAPAKTLKVTFPGAGVISCGNLVSVDEVASPPNVELEEETDKLYTIIMADPDAPSRENPKNADFLHWMVVNAPGGRVGEGEEVIEYMGAQPPPKSGPHRYALLAFEQPTKITDVSAKTRRAGFKVQKWASEHKLGNPIAGNFFQTRID